MSSRMRWTAAVAVTAALLAAVLPAAAPQVSAAAATTADSTAIADPLLDPAAFANPPAAFRPKTRWWWATPYDAGEFAAEIEEVAKAGFGGVEVAFNEDGWATEAQREMLRTSLAAADRHGISLDMTMGAAWPVRSPAVDKSTGLSEQELQYGRRDLLGPSVYAGPPPGPGDGMAGTLYGVTAARVVLPGTPVPAPLLGPNLTPTGPTAAPLYSTVLDPASLVDLTGAVDAAGNLSWKVPAGHWVLFGFWQRPATENVMDHFNADSARAVVDYLDANMLGDTASLLPGTGGSFFEDSLELDVAEVMWTGRFADEFRRRRGYDVRKYLPLLFVQGIHHYPVLEKSPAADFDLPGGAGERVRHDYFQTLTDLYVDEHIQPFQQWAGTHGMRFRTQPAFGAALDVTRSAREVAKAGGIADDESLNAGDPAMLGDTNWRFAMDHYRSVVGGVHQGGGREISSELGAMFWREYEPGLADLKAVMDKQWAAGITTPILHGFAYQPPGSAWPGRSQFSGVVSDSWNHRNFPQWSMWRPLTDYWARGNLVLQQGRPQVDLAVYRDGFLTSAASFAALATDALNHQVDPALPVQVLTTPDGRELIDDTLKLKPTRLFDGEPLERAGFTFEYVDPQGLLEPGAAGNGVLYPGGPSYRALVIDERALPATVAEAIAREAEKGLRVVFVGALPDRGTGYAAATDEDTRVRAAVQRMLAMPTVRRSAAQAGVLGALADAGVTPAASWSRALPVYSNHRRTDGVDYWYLWNAGTTAVSFDGSFRTSGALSELNMWTGEIQPLGRYRSTGDRVVVPLELGPGETKVLAFRHGRSQRLHAVSADAGEVVPRDGGLELRDTSAGARSVRLSDGSERNVTMPELPEPLSPASWSLHVDEVGPNGTTPHDLELTELADWRDIWELSRSSGTGTYRTSLTVPSSWVASSRGTYLDLGLVHGAIQVSMNGRRVAPDSVAGRRFDVSEFIRAGSNDLEIVLATTLKNRLAGLALRGDPRPLTIAAQPATQPYGLLGPVRLVPFARASVSRGEGPR